MKVKFSCTKENWEKKGKLSLGDAALKKNQSDFNMIIICRVPERS